MEHAKRAIALMEEILIRAQLDEAGREELHEEAYIFVQEAPEELRGALERLLAQVGQVSFHKH